MTTNRDGYWRKWLPLRRHFLVNGMLKRLKALYREYKPYIRVDMIMYAVLILMIIIYFIVSAVF